LNFDFIAGHWYLFLVYALVSGTVSAAIAEYKRRDQGNWFVYGLAGGIVTVVVLLAIKKLPDPPKNNLLLDADNHLRSGWRVLLFFVALIASYIILAILAKLSRVVPPQSFLFLFYIAVLLVTILMLKVIDKRRFVSVGFPLHGRALKEILIGFLIGAVMIAAVAVVELSVGALKLSLRPGVGVILLLRNFGLSFIFFAYFAMGEELIFRGYPFQAFVEGMGPVAATILMSLMFGALHLGNPDASFLSTANTMLAGVWLSVAYLKTRTLYFPFGLHFAWNFVQSFFLSLPVSGLLTNRTIFVPTDYGPDWLTGGRYGPEAGVGTTVVMVVVIVYFILEKRIKPTYDFAAINSRIVSEKSEPNTLE
jgi:membrane protease YdiL (CAAX protease family)